MTDKRMNWIVVKAFVCGFLLATLLAIAVFRNTTLYIKQARVVSESHNTITVRFYHDPTDQVLNVKLPVPKFPVPSFRNKSVIEHVTVGIWNDDDLQATMMMQDDVLNILENRILSKPRFVTDWSEDMPEPSK